MRAVVQRVNRAEVRVDDETVGSIGSGLLALVGVGADDVREDAVQLAEKLVHLRVFPDDGGRMNRSLIETGGMLGVVSQFTLLGDCRRGRRPSYGAAASPDQAEPLLETLVEHARGQGIRVETGRFRAHMEVTLVNDGPVTLLLDTKRIF